VNVENHQKSLEVFRTPLHHPYPPHEKASRLPHHRPCP
jgi:hypothetical protein